MAVGNHPASTWIKSSRSAVGAARRGARSVAAEGCAFIRINIDRAAGAIAPI